MSISQKFRSLRKAIASIASAAVLSMAVVVAPQASAQTFNDVSPDHWAYSYVEQLVADGVIDVNDNYRPDDNLNRAELVKIAVEATTGIQADLIPETPTFDDVAADAWYYQYVETAAALGIVEGYRDASGNLTGKFGPGDTVNRAAATKILVNAYGVPTDLDPAGVFTDVDAAAWYYDFVTTAYNQSIIDGYKNADGTMTGMFGPGDPVTRAQVAKLAANSANPVERVVDTDDDDSDDTPADPGAKVNGDLEVSLSAKSMASATVPRSANVAAASFDLTAGADDIKVTSLTFVRGGVGTRTSISSLVLKDGAGNRISKSKTINSDDLVTFTLLSGGITIEAGETQSVTIVVATAAAGSGNHNFSLVSADAVMSNAGDVVGDFPVTSNTFEIGSTAAGAVTMTNDGTPTNPKVGETDVTIAKFKLENGNIEDVSVTQITLKETGTANEKDAMTNIKLLADGAEVATGTLNDKYIAFVFGTPLKILKNKNVKFKVTADIIGEAAKTLALDLESLVDIEGIGANFGFGIGVVDSFTASTITIQAGAISIVKVEPVDKMRKDKKDVVLGTVKVTANSGNSVEMKAFNVTIVATGDDVDDILENVELHDVASGSVYDLTASTTANTTITYYDRDIGIALTQGETKTFEVRADTANLAIIGKTITASITGIGDAVTTDGIEFQETIDDQYVSDVVPSSISFKTITGEAASATVSIITQSASTNAVIGSKGVQVLEFDVKAGTASPLTLTEVKVASTGATTVSNTKVNAMTLYKKEGETMTQLDVVSGSQIAANTATFEGFSVDIPASGTARFLVTLDVVDDENQANATMRFTLTSLEMDDDDSDSITIAVVDGVNKTATAITGADSARTVIIKGAGTLAIAEDNTDTATDKAKLVVGNTTSDFVASFEVTSTNEAIILKDINIVGTGTVTVSNYKAALSDIILFKEDKTTEIARKAVTGLTTTFDDVNYTSKEGTENIYVKVKANKIGKDAAGTTLAGIKLEMHVTDADGASSNKTVKGQKVSTATVISTTNYVYSEESLAFSTVPTRISAAEFVASCGSKTVATQLTNGSNDVAILKLTTDASTNTKVADGSSLKTVLTALNYTVDTDATVSSMTLEKINGTSDSVAAVTVPSTGGTATVDLTAGSITASNIEIDNSTSVCYLVKATMSGMSSVAQGYIQIKMNGLDSGNIAYKSNDAGASTISALLLSDSTIESTKISSKY